MKVVIIGQTSYDITLELKETLVENKKYRFENDFTCPGGPAFNASCLLGKWGKETYLVSRIADDYYGLQAKKQAEKNNVNLQYLIKDKTNTTPYSIILTRDNNRTIFNMAGKLEKTDYIVDLNDVDYILTDAHEKDISFSYFEKFPQAIKIMDGGSFNTNRLEVAKKVDYLIVSSQFAQGYTNELLTLENYQQIFQEIENINHKNAVITWGENGLIYRYNEDIKIMPAYKTDCVDSTGAGDIFHGSFTYFMMSGYDYYSSLSMANKTAAFSVRKRGGYTSIPELNDIL